MIDTLISNLKQIEQGVSTLSSGTTKLQEATAILASKTNELDKGAKELYSGMTTLNNGITKFNQEGISKITSIGNGSLNVLETKVKTLVKLGEDYETFTMKSSKDEGTTKFVLVVDSKKKVVKEVKQEKKTEKVTLLDRIINLFK